MIKIAVSGGYIRRRVAENGVLGWDHDGWWSHPPSLSPIHIERERYLNNNFYWNY
jgi:hypothetical protein